MPATIARPEAGFRFVPGVFQYSAGVAALPGFRLERARFADLSGVTAEYAQRFLPCPAPSNLIASLKRPPPVGSSRHRNNPNAQGARA